MLIPARGELEVQAPHQTLLWISYLLVQVVQPRALQCPHLSFFRLGIQVYPHRPIVAAAAAVLRLQVRLGVVLPQVLAEVLVDILKQSFLTQGQPTPIQLVRAARAALV